MNESMEGPNVRETQHIAVVKRLVDVLDSLGIPYAIGGSMASSAYGTIRFTQDADITVQSFSQAAGRFYELVKDEFYISEQAMREALDHHGSFNVIHFQTGFKIDIFVQRPSAFEQQVLGRRRMAKLSQEIGGGLFIVSPEDIVLLKLRWFKETDCTSQRQWDDVLGVLAVQGEALDFAYLDDSAKKLGLEDLLSRAKREAQA
jgi:hypothetical protein